MAEAQLLPGPLGDAPLIGVRLTPSSDSSTSAISYIVDIGENVPLGEMAVWICRAAALPDDSIAFMYEGRTLNLWKTLQDNDVLLPGPAARRRGDKVEIKLDVKLDVLSAAWQAQGQAAAEKERQHLMCPITFTLMQDPVCPVDSGNTYDREALFKFWETSGSSRDPLTNVELASQEVRTNLGARRELQAFLDGHPGYLPEGWESRELPPPDAPRRRRPRREAPEEVIGNGLEMLGLPPGLELPPPDAPRRWNPEPEAPEEPRALEEVDQVDWTRKLLIWLLLSTTLCVCMQSGKLWRKID